VREKKLVFVCFDAERDRSFFRVLQAESRLADAPFQILSHSRPDEPPLDCWERLTKTSIGWADAVVVLLGAGIDAAPGVRRELEIARAMRKPICQLQPPGLDVPPLEGAGEVYPWTWANLMRLCNCDFSPRRAAARHPD
jgi:hypothetical protein